MFSLRKINILAVQQKIAIPPYDGQEIVEIVSHSPGQPANRFHLMSLSEPVFKLALFPLCFLNARPHSTERVGDFPDFVTSS